MSSTPELKPCPFCGGEVIIANNYEYDTTTYMALCKDCRASSCICDTPEEAAEEWNRRIKDE